MKVYVVSEKKKYACEKCCETACKQQDCERCGLHYLEIYKIWDKNGEAPTLCYKHLKNWIAQGNKPYLIKLVKDEDGFRSY
jgi:hypothetical protein